MSGVGLHSWLRAPNRYGRILLCSCAVGVGAMWLVGCAQQPEAYPQASGVVTLDGQPIADAGVVFEPVASGPLGMGTTDAQGRFSVTTANRPGAPAGKYRVAISKTVVSAAPGQIGRPTGDQRIAGGELKETNLVPMRYGNAKTSELFATVGEKENQFAFDLTSDDPTAQDAGETDGADGDQLGASRDAAEN